MDVEEAIICCEDGPLVIELIRKKGLLAMLFMLCVLDEALFDVDALSSVCSVDSVASSLFFRIGLIIRGPSLW